MSDPKEAASSQPILCGNHPSKGAAFMLTKMMVEPPKRPVIMNIIIYLFSPFQSTVLRAMCKEMSSSYDRPVTHLWVPVGRWK